MATITGTITAIPAGVIEGWVINFDADVYDEACDFDPEIFTAPADEYCPFLETIWLR